MSRLRMCGCHADLQRHLRDAHVEGVLRKRTCARCTSSSTGQHGSLSLQPAVSAPEESFVACSSSPGGNSPGTYQTASGPAAGAAGSPQTSRLGSEARSGPVLVGAPVGDGQHSHGNDLQQPSDVSARCVIARML